MREGAPFDGDCSPGRAPPLLSAPPPPPPSLFTPPDWSSQALKQKRGIVCETTRAEAGARGVDERRTIDRPLWVGLL
jgi:hypothetical protein